MPLVMMGECVVGLVTRGGCAVKLSDIRLRVEPAGPFLRLLPTALWVEVGVVMTSVGVAREDWEARWRYLC